MQLPGGVWAEGKLRRDFTFRPLDGHVELAITESNAGTQDTPDRVTAILQAALQELAGLPVNGRNIWALSVGDRQFLMRQLALMLGKDDKWFSADCSACDETFDFPIKQSELPVKEAGEGYPYARAQTSIGELQLHVPTGRDQSDIPSGMNTEEASLWLLERCLQEGMRDRDSGDAIKDLNKDERLFLEQALEDASPEIGNLVEVECPVCGKINRVYLDPYAPVMELKTELFTQIHTLAATYHWSQKEILDLPLARRQTYLSLIDQARGMVE